MERELPKSTGAVQLPKAFPKACISGSVLFQYTSEDNMCHLKLQKTNIYKKKFEQVYPIYVEEDKLTSSMIEVLQQYTGSGYKDTNISLLLDHEIDWLYINRLRSLIRGLYQRNLVSTYYRGVHLSKIELNYYKGSVGECYYTTSFTSFSTDRSRAFNGNTLMILTVSKGNRLNIAQIERWSQYPDEKEGILALGSKIKINSVKYETQNWHIELDLVGNE
ncbi:hypothetical protein I4U23_027097 [Adineta vaga]|nr:hypothetical protein I4U23_027097 [Adineta vaga]